MPSILRKRRCVRPSCLSYNDDGEMTIKDTDGETYTFYLKGE